MGGKLKFISTIQESRLEYLLSCRITTLEPYSIIQIVLKTSRLVIGSRIIVIVDWLCNANIQFSSFFSNFSVPQSIQSARSTNGVGKGTNIDVAAKLVPN